MMVEALPAAPFVMGEAEFRLELLVVPLDVPAQFDRADESGQGCVFRQGRQPVFCWLRFVLGTAVARLLAYLCTGKESLS